jgi:hypothetical protein
MLVEEALWFERRIHELDPELVSPLLNVGSSTLDFRTQSQPWIDRHIFGPMRERRQEVLHLDLQEAAGVDIAADLTLTSTRERLHGLGVRSAICSNLLEHVSDRAAVCSAITSVLPSGGYLLASCPRRYPRHDDPFDTMYRPEPAELAAEFAGMDVVASEVVSGGTYFDYLGRSYPRLARTMARLALPFYAPGGWLSTARHASWVGRHFEASCVLLRKR